MAVSQKIWNWNNGVYFGYMHVYAQWLTINCFTRWVTSHHICYWSTSDVPIYTMIDNTLSHATSYFTRHMQLVYILGTCIHTESSESFRAYIILCRSREMSFVSNIRLKKSNHLDILHRACMASSLPCSVQYFKTIGQLRQMLWTNDISGELSLRWVSNGYPILQRNPASIICRTAQ